MAQVVQLGQVDGTFTVTHALETVLALGILGAGGYGLYTVVQQKNKDDDQGSETIPADPTPSPPTGGGDSADSKVADEEGVTGVQGGGIAALVVGALAVIGSFFLKGWLSHPLFLVGLALAIGGAFLGIFGMKGEAGYKEAVPGVAVFLSITGVLALVAGRIRATRMVGFAGALLSAGAVGLLSFAVDDMLTKISYFSLAGVTALMYAFFIGSSRPSGKLMEGGARKSTIKQLGGPLVFWVALVATIAQVWALVMTGMSSPESGLVYVPLILTGGIFLLLFSFLYWAIPSGKKGISDEDARRVAETTQGVFRMKKDSGGFAASAAGGRQVPGTRMQFVESQPESDGQETDDSRSRRSSSLSRESTALVDSAMRLSRRGVEELERGIRESGLVENARSVEGSLASNMDKRTVHREVEQLEEFTGSMPGSRGHRLSSSSGSSSSESSNSSDSSGPVKALMFLGIMTILVLIPAIAFDPSLSTATRIAVPILLFFPGIPIWIVISWFLGGLIVLRRARARHERERREREGRAE